MTRCFVTLLTAAATMLSPGAQPRELQTPPPLAFEGVQPHLAKLGDRVFLAYGEDDVVNVHVSRDGGQTFGPAAKLTVPGRMSLGMHRGPRIAATARSVIVAVVAGAKGGGADGDLLLYRSVDGGVTFAPPMVINDVPGSAREGLHALAATAEGFVSLVWLDLREKGTRVYSAVSRTHGTQWSADELIYASPSGSVCECCHPSIAVGLGASGRDRAVMFRNNLDGNRDMYVVQSLDSVSYEAPRKSGTGSWKLDACPMDGGSIVLYGSRVVSVWRRENDVYMSVLGSPEKRIGAGRDPVIARFGEYLDIAWSSPQGLMLMRDGRPPISLGDGRFPAIVSLERRTVVAWESPGSVKTLSLAR